MLIIRREQKDRCAAQVRAVFEERMLTHLEAVFGQRCESMGRAGVRQMVRHGIEQAGSYGISAEREVCKYIDLMFIFGEQYDVDPALPWAAEILNDEHETPPKMERLFPAALEFIEGTAANESDP